MHFRGRRNAFDEKLPGYSDVLAVVGRVARVDVTPVEVWAIALVARVGEDNAIMVIRRSG